MLDSIALMRTVSSRAVRKNRCLAWWACAVALSSASWCLHSPVKAVGDREPQLTSPVA
jgi:hypothetical protein